MFTPSEFTDLPSALSSGMKFAFSGIGFPGNRPRSGLASQMNRTERSQTGSQYASTSLQGGMSTADDSAAHDRTFARQTSYPSAARPIYIQPVPTFRIPPMSHQIGISLGSDSSALNTGYVGNSLTFSRDIPSPVHRYHSLSTSSNKSSQSLFPESAMTTRNTSLAPCSPAPLDSLAPVNAAAPGLGMLSEIEPLHLGKMLGDLDDERKARENGSGPTASSTSGTLSLGCYPEGYLSIDWDSIKHTLEYGGAL